MRAIWVVLALALAGAAWGQTYMEGVESATVMESDALMGTEEDPDSTVFRVADSDTVRSGVYSAWKSTAVILTAVGDSAAARIYFYGGRADRLPGRNLANDEARQYVLLDSLDVAGAGVYKRQISDALKKCKTFYFEVVGQTGNGHETYLEWVWAMRERY